MKKISKVLAALIVSLVSAFLPLQNIVHAAQVVATINYSYLEGEAVDFSINGTMVDPGSATPTSDNSWTTTTSYENNGDTVTFRFEPLYITVLTSLKINGADYSDQLPSTKEELAAKYADQHVITSINVPKSPTNNYIIETKTANITANQQFMGNFLWENDESEIHAFPDDIIGKGTLSFVKAVYNNNTYNSVDELNNNCGLNYCHWSDSIVTEQDPDGSTGGAELPIGTVLTVKLIPNAGYQLVSFGINGGDFEPQQNIGEYTFTIRGGNGHLAAKFEPVANTVNTKNTRAIASGSISFSGKETSMGIGTARLDVSDVELSNEKVASFKNATPAGYDISDYMDISLFNTVYKAKADASWDTQVTELDGKAIITLKLAEGTDASSAVLIHERHDGTYETIEPVSYDPATRIAVFEVDSFSNYALATKSISAPNSGAATAAAASATSSSVITIMTLTIVSAGAWFTYKKFRG